MEYCPSIVEKFQDCNASGTTCFFCHIMSLNFFVDIRIRLADLSFLKPNYK